MYRPKWEENLKGCSRHRFFCPYLAVEIPKFYLEIGRKSDLLQRIWRRAPFIERESLAFTTKLGHWSPCRMLAVRKRASDKGWENYSTNIEAVKDIQITAETRYHFNKGTVNLLLYVNIYQQDTKFRTDFGEKGRVTCRLRDPSCNENLMENPVIVGVPYMHSGQALTQYASCALETIQTSGVAGRVAELA